MPDPEDSPSEQDDPDEEEEDVLDMFGEGGDASEPEESADGNQSEGDEPEQDGESTESADASDSEGADDESAGGDDDADAHADEEESDDGEADEEPDTEEDDGEEDGSTPEVADEDDEEIVADPEIDDPEAAELDTVDEAAPVDTDSVTEDVFSAAAEDEEEDFDDEEFERALTRDEQSAEEILDTLEESGALDPESDTEIDLSSEDLTTDDYTADYLANLFPLLHRSGEWVSGQYDAKEFFHPDTAPVVKDLYTWEHFKIEYYYTDYDWDTFTGQPPTAGSGRFSDSDADESGVIEFDAEEHLGHDPDHIEHVLSQAHDNAEEVSERADENMVAVNEELDEDDFFTTRRGVTTLVNRYDLEKTVPAAKKKHFEEINRYWVNKPFACVVLFRSMKENEMKYYVIEPHLTPIEKNVREFLVEKLRNTIKYAGDQTVKSAEDNIGRAEVIEQETYKLLDRYNIYDRPTEDSGGLVDSVKGAFGDDKHPEDALNEAGSDSGGFLDSIKGIFGGDDGPPEVDDGPAVQRDHVFTPPQDLKDLDGISVRPEPVLIEEDSALLNEYQVEKLLYYLKRDFVGFQKIDAIKRDINVEDVSCNGYNMPVFVYHTDYENIITNVFHGEDDLDEFVVKLAQRSGKGISKRQPQVDCTLPDGSRAQLTLGTEVSDHGTNYTIRQFKDVPFTPVDLINWKTFSLNEMAFLWLAIENNKSLIFAGGTASGKTTSLNAVSLFIPSSSKIVSIEDTREVELPQRNWIASVTRPSFADDDKGDIDEFDLLEAALRQRPDYIVMGEIRGEEGRTAFQVMSTGHTTYTTFHADSVAEVLKRFTTDPINVSKTLFTALDLVSIQEATRVDGHKVRRNQVLTEVNGYDAETDEINVQDVYQWQAETDNFIKQTGSSTLEEIKFDRGWNQQKLDEELFKRKTVLAYLIKSGMSKYVEVGATIQAFMTDPETTLALIASEQLEDSLDDLREMESVSIDVDPEKEALVPRPEAPDDILTEVDGVLDEAEERLFTEEMSNVEEVNLADAFDDSGAEPADDEEPDTDAALDMLQEEAEQSDAETAEDDSATEELEELPGTAGSEPASDTEPEPEPEPEQPESADVESAESVDEEVEEVAEPESESEPETEPEPEQEVEETADESSGGIDTIGGSDDGDGLNGVFGDGDDEEETTPSGGSIFEDEGDDPFSDTDDLDDLFDDGEIEDDEDDDEELSFNVDDDDGDGDLDDIF